MMSAVANTTSPFASFVNAPTVHVESDVVPELARWLTERRRHECSTVLLAQRVSEVTHHPVDTWSLADLVDATALAQVIYSTGLREARATQAAITYGVFAFREDRPDPGSRFLFRIDATGGNAGLEVAATKDERTEIIKLLMSHADVSARLSLGHSRGILDQYERLIEQSNTHQNRLLEQAHKRIAELEAREVEALELRNQLQSLTLEREREAAKARERTEALRYGIDQLVKAAPVIAGALAVSRSGAAPPSPPAPSPVEGLVAEFFGSITDEQGTALAALLRSDQVAILMRLHEVARARTPPPPGGEPSAPAMSTETGGATREPQTSQANDVAPT